jgi:hypothetical protein
MSVAGEMRKMFGPESAENRGQVDCAFGGFHQFDRLEDLSRPLDERPRDLELPALIRSLVRSNNEVGLIGGRSPLSCLKR